MSDVCAVLTPSIVVARVLRAVMSVVLVLTAVYSDEILLSVVYSEVVMLSIKVVLSADSTSTAATRLLSADIAPSVAVLLSKAVTRVPNSVIAVVLVLTAVCSDYIDVSVALLFSKAVTRVFNVVISKLARAKVVEFVAIKVDCDELTSSVVYTRVVNALIAVPIEEFY